MPNDLNRIINISYGYLCLKEPHHFFIEVPVPCHESEYVVCATGIDLTSFKNFLLDFGTLPKM
jgi:hypothetical protein